MKYLFLFVLLIGLITLCCKESSKPQIVEPPPEEPAKLALTLNYAGLTDAEFAIKIENPKEDMRLEIYRNNSLLHNWRNIMADTTCYDSALAVNQAYTYYVKLYTKQILADSQALSLTTMDTTCHNFILETFTFGGGGSTSYLKDVIIITENDIWAVGSIHTPETGRYDSVFNWIDPYNAVHWDGQQWTLKRIETRLFPNSTSTMTGVLRAVTGFCTSDIYTTDGGQVIRYNGTSWGEWTFLWSDINDTTFGSMKKFWGTSSTEIWGVGEKGNLFYYNGSGWQRMDAGIDLPIQDICGYEDANTNERYILCCASEKYYVSDKKLIEIQPDNTIEVKEWPFPNNSIHSVWFKNKYNIFICGGGVYNKTYKGNYKKMEGIPSYYSNRIRGNEINDVLLAGDFGLLCYYNGKKWRRLTEYDLGHFKALDYKYNTAIAVGRRNNDAVITMIRR